MRRHLLLTASLLMGLPGGGLSAQSPEERAGLRAFEDSLATLTRVDAPALVRLYTDLARAATSAREDALARLRLGFTALRLAVLRGEPGDLDRAQDAFAEAAQRQPEWPYVWYGKGAALLVSGESSVIAVENLRQWLRRDHLSRAVDAFDRALELDAAFAPALAGLADAALTQRIRPELQRAQAALRAAGSVEPMVLLHRGLVERALGAVDSAVAALQAYVAAGGDPGVGHLELARTHFLAGRPEEGARNYYAGSRYEVSPAALTLYRGDIALIASPQELAAFDGVTESPARAAWLAEFWGNRDTLGQRGIGERLAEHYRRWFYALRHYRLISRHRHYDITDVYRPGQREFDDRGVIYLRHGEPDRHIVLGNAEPNESWLYERAEGRWVLHFAARGKVTDYKLVESLLDVFGYGAALRLQTEPLQPPSRETMELVESRVPLGTVYLHLSRPTGFSGRARLLQAEREAGRRSIAVATTTDSYPRR